MEGNNHPIVNCMRELWPIYGNFRMEEVVLPNDVIFAGFRRNDVKVTLLSCSAETTQCAGSMCDKQDLFRNGRMESRCACMTNNQRMAPTTIVLQLKLQMNDGGEEMTINNFTSSWFVNNYVLKNRLAPHIRASHFSNDIEDEITISTRRVFKYINDRGGFRIIGWAKRGMIRDQGAGVQEEIRGYGQQLNQANNNNMVENGEVRYHVVRFDPSVPENIQLEELMPSSTTWKKETTE